MWPFATRRSHAEEVIDAAIPFAAECWREFRDTSGIASNIHLRDQIAFFAPGFASRARMRFPALVHAADEIVLMIVAQGVALSGSHDRRQIEKALGIILP
jgi:hypothetical protein